MLCSLCLPKDIQTFNRYQIGVYGVRQWSSNGGSRRAVFMGAEVATGLALQNFRLVINLVYFIINLIKTAKTITKIIIL